ncbi:MAG: hypothetical protein AAB434_10895 [Planctomycetota bacterium]
MRRSVAWAFVLVVVVGCTRSQEHYAVGPYPHLSYRMPKACTSTQFAGDMQVIGEEGKAIGYLRHETITLREERYPRDQWFVLDARFATIGMVTDKGGTYRFTQDGPEYDWVKVGDYTPDLAAKALLRYQGKVALIPATATPVVPGSAPTPPTLPKKEGEGE